MGARFSIYIEQSQETFTCGDSQHLLGGMESLGRRGIPVGCRGGGCGVCKIRVTAGEYRVKKMSRAYVSEAEQADGIVLACKTYPLSDLSVSVVGKMVRAVTRGAGADARRSGTQSVQR